MQFSKECAIFGVLVLPVLIGFPAQNLALAEAEVQAQVLAVEGKVLVDGKEIKGHPMISAGSTIETSSGKLTLATGQDNVMKLSQDSRLKLDKLANGQLNGVLEKGSVEGIRKMEGQSSANGSTRVGTRAGTFEIKGGRYLVVVPKQATSSVQFLAVDGNSRILSTDAATNSAESIPVNQGELVVMKPGQSSDVQPSGPARTIASSPVFVPEVRLATQTEIQSAMKPSESLVPPRTPTEFTRVVTDLPQNNAVAAPSSSPQNEVVNLPNTLNRDPMQTPRIPRVNAAFIY